MAVTLERARAARLASPQSNEGGPASPPPAGWPPFACTVTLALALTLTLTLTSTLTPTLTLNPNQAAVGEAASAATTAARQAAFGAQDAARNWLNDLEGSMRNSDREHGDGREYGDSLPRPARPAPPERTAAEHEQWANALAMQGLDPSAYMASIAAPIAAAASATAAATAAPFIATAAATTAAVTSARDSVASSATSARDSVASAASSTATAAAAPFIATANATTAAATNARDAAAAAAAAAAATAATTTAAFTHAFNPESWPQLALGRGQTKKVVGLPDEMPPGGARPVGLPPSNP